MMLRTLIILYLSVILTSLASAEVYKWEDVNGMHYTDSPGSVPEKYREKVYAETSEQIRNSTPQVRPGISKLNLQAVVNQINQVSVYQANLEQQRRTTELMKQQQARALAASSRNLEGAFQSLARFMAMWIMIGFFVVIAWMVTIVDIVTSEFTSPSNKTVWMLLVILIPLLGMILYIILGHSQKSNVMRRKAPSYEDFQQKELLARLKPRDPKDKDFVI